eukprot:XP_011614764.1 PREDICTED: G-protein coupled receptor 35-like isoform X2 [Takifugu rubripes]
MALLSKTLSLIQISMCNGTNVTTSPPCKVDYLSALAYTPLFLLGQVMAEEEGDSFCSVSGRIITILLKEDNRSEEKMSTIGIVTANMAVFIFCYMPIHIGFLVNYYYKFPPDWQEVLSPVHIYLLVCEWIASTNCCFDSISYYFLLRRYYSDAMKRVSLWFQLKS